MLDEAATCIHLDHTYCWRHARELVYGSIPGVVARHLNHEMQVTKFSEDVMCLGKVQAAEICHL